MKKIKTVLLMGMIALLSFSFVTEDAFARGGSRGGGSRGFSRPSRSRSTPSKQKQTQQKNKTWGSKDKSTSTRANAKPKMTAAQQKSLETAKKNGTAFKSKAAAQDAFKSKYASTYTSKYSTKPTTRPEHIPQTTKVGNTTYNVSYNQQYGGYGYMGPSGAWIMYDMMTDAIMLNAMMSRNHYVVQPQVVHTSPVVHSSGGSVLTFIIVTILIIIGIVVVCKVVKEFS